MSTRFKVKVGFKFLCLMGTKNEKNKIYLKRSIYIDMGSMKPLFMG